MNRLRLGPFRWFLIAISVLGLAGVVYWLFRKPQSAKTSATGTVPIVNALAGLLNMNSGVVDGTDEGGGNYSANPAWVIGDYGAESGTDYEGNAFVNSSAPTIPFEAKVQPYQNGVDYDFAEQTAKGVALFKRFPEFSLSDVQIHMMGPWYDSDSANAHFTRGITTMTALPEFRQGPTNVTTLPADRKNTMLPDDLFWQIAGNLANNLGSSDSRYSALRQLADNHVLVLDENAYVSLGRAVWDSERNVTDNSGQGTRYMSIDIEYSSPYSNYWACVGWLYQGYCQAAAESGVTVIPFLYGGREQVTILGFSNRQNGSGDPEYLDSQHDFFGYNDPTLQACQAFGGILAVDTYLQGIWGNEPLLNRDGNGDPVLDGNGRPYFSSLSQTVAYGQAIPLENNEAEACLRDLYEQSTRLYLQQHRLAGEYPSRKGMKRPTLSNTEVGSYTRYTNEGTQGIQQNDRPVPAWQLEMFNALNMFLTPELWCWGVDFNHAPGPLGSNHSNVWSYQAHGVAEMIAKAAHRHSAFDNIQASDFKWCWFNLAMVNNMQTDGDGYHQKAICHGKLRNVNGTVWLEVLFAFPATDNRSTLFQVYVEQGGLQSETYNCELRSGRHYYYDCWQLPSSFSYDQLEGGNVVVSYPDVLGVQRTHRGDYRQMS